MNQVYGATGKLYQGTPIICGGTDENGLERSECYSLEHGNWKRQPDLSSPRERLKSSILSIPGQVKDSLIITGGLQGGTQFFDLVEVFDGKLWNTQLVSSLPTPVFSHCMVALNSSMLLSIAGYDFYEESRRFTDDTNFFDANQNSWFSGPKLKHGRAGHVCGLMYVANSTKGQKERIVVVAGGDDGDDDLTSVELLSLDNLSQGWVEGPSLPLGVSISAMVEFDDSLVMIGGYGVPHGGIKQLYQLSSVDGPWEVMEQELKETRYSHVAILVPDELVVCN